LADESKDEMLIKLANFRAARRNERRELEWRLTVAVWAALAGAIYKGICFPWWPFVVIVLIHIWWIGLNWVRNERDMRKAFFDVDRLHVLAVGEKPLTEPRIPEVFAAWVFRRSMSAKSDRWPQVQKLQVFGWLLDAMFWVEIAVTSGLASAAYLVGQQHCALTVTLH
jgi:hypothetical protein